MKLKIRIINKRAFYWIAFSVLFSSLASAIEPVNIGVLKTKIAKNYHALKAKADSGEKVRVIARVKGITKRQPGKKTVSQTFTTACNILEKSGLIPQKEFPRLGLLALELDSHALDVLINSGLIEKVEEDIPMPPNLVQSINLIDADFAHNEGFTGSNQAVAILDTGVEFWHPFFENRLVEEACFSSNTSVSTSLCPNGQEVQLGENAASDCSPRGIRGCDHGTHVAGIAAGINQNMSGVAPGADIVAVQVFSEFPATYPTCNGVRCILSWTSDQLAALEWVLNESTTNNVAAINVSIGGGSFTSACDTNLLAETIEDLRGIGIATVIASGNGGASDSVSSPGCISSAITVGSTLDSSDRISGFSNSASMVDIVAPGSSITSSVVNGGYGTKSGTSMAAPHVTGAFAVMRELNPTLTVRDIEQSLKINGVSILDARNNLSFPRLDLYASVLNPVALIDSDSNSIPIFTTMILDGSESFDPEGIALTYDWEFGDTGEVVITNTPFINHDFNIEGEFEISLIVDDGVNESQPDFLQVTVYDPVKVIIPVLSLLLH